MLILYLCMFMNKTLVIQFGTIDFSTVWGNLNVFNLILGEVDEQCQNLKMKVYLFRFR